MLNEKMQLKSNEKYYVMADGVASTIEYAEYAHVIERDGQQIQAVPHRIVIDRSQPTAEHPMPDGTVKTTAEIVAEVDA